VISVLVVDDHALVRRTLRAILETEPSLKVVGEAADGLEAIRFAQEVHPDVMLIDVHMPGMNGIELARHIQARIPTICLIGMSSDSRAWVEEAFLSAGGRAFLQKEFIPGHVAEVIRKACPV
jgi:DNA-binding NarL/FixJ family response regulator